MPNTMPTKPPHSWCQAEKQLCFNPLVLPSTHCKHAWAKWVEPSPKGWPQKIEVKLHQHGGIKPWPSTNQGLWTLCTYIHIHTRTYTYIHIHTHTYTYIHIHTHTYTYIHIHTHTYTYIHIHTHAYTYIHVHTHTYTYIHIHTHTNTYIHIHTHTYTYIHIHTHTYTYIHIHTGSVRGNCFLNLADYYYYFFQGGGAGLWQTILFFKLN